MEGGRGGGRGGRGRGREGGGRVDGGKKDRRKKETKGGYQQSLQLPHISCKLCLYLLSALGRGLEGSW